ncbi:hypothetical protein KUCAC02_037530, partial [Chaenocephalus aceratus]
ETKEESSAFICPLCDKDCQSQHQLTMHIRQHNTDAGTVDHSCSICGKCLSSASSLDRHMLVHSGERPYKCDLCCLSFRTHRGLLRHNAGVHKLLPQDPSGRPFIQNNPSIPPGFNELAFIDFSCKKFAHIAQEAQVQEAQVQEAQVQRPKSRRPKSRRPKSRRPKSRRLKSRGPSPGGPKSRRPESRRPESRRPESRRPKSRRPESRRPKSRGPSPGGPSPEARVQEAQVQEARVQEAQVQRPESRRPKSRGPSPGGPRTEKEGPALRCPQGGRLPEVSAGVGVSLRCPQGGRLPEVSAGVGVSLRCRQGGGVGVSLRCAQGGRLPEVYAGWALPEVWCETNLRRCISKFHRFVCDSCDRAFPLRTPRTWRTWNQRNRMNSRNRKEPEENASSEEPEEEDGSPEGPQSDFLQALGLQHVSTVIHGPSADEVHQAHLDSIKVIQVAPPHFLSGGLSLPLMDAMSLLQPFLPPPAFLMPDGGAAAASSGVKPGEELADIQQILRGASLSLPGNKAAALPGGHGSLQKSMPPLKSKPRPLTPRSTPRPLTPRSTPPPLQISQHASLGCITGAELGDAHTPLSDSPPASCTAVHEEAERSGRKPGAKAGSPTANGGAANGSKGSYPCRFCEQTFSFSGVLQAHMRFHLGIVPHQCNICDYVAPDKATLIRHLRTHSGERPYVCRVCHYPFTVKANCERHLRKKHGKTSRKDIEKNIKYISSPRRLALRLARLALRFARHRHHGDGAGRHGDAVPSYRSLQIHLRTHNGCSRKPYECRRCGAAFLAKRNCIHHLLKQHPEVQEREIERHISTLLPPVRHQEVQERERHINTLLPPVRHHTVKQEETDQPLDFSRGRGGDSPSVVKQETPPPPSVADQPIDLSIISSVSGATDLLKPRPFPEIKVPPPTSCQEDDAPPAPPAKILANTDANKFSNFLQSQELGVKREDQSAASSAVGGEESVGGGEKEVKPPVSKGKKNAYSNSVQKMTCPFCPRCDAFFSTKSNYSANASTDSGSAPTAGSPTPSDQPMTSSANSSPTHKPNSDVSHLQEEELDDDDCHSNKSLDLNFGKKLIDFKLSGSSPPVQDQTSSSSEGPEKIPPPSSSPPPQVKDYKHVCRVCKKSFRYATTLARHERAHLSDETPPPSCEGRRLDKRKKICNVCGKRFWSLQDLTRHMRSHQVLHPVIPMRSHT